MKKIIIVLLCTLLLGSVFTVAGEAGTPRKGQVVESLTDPEDSERLEGIVMENNVSYLVVHERVIHVGEETRLEDSRQDPVDILAMEAMKNVLIEGTTGEENSVDATLIRLLDP